MNILILENDQALCKHLSDNLEEYQVFSANNIASARKLFNIESIDLILLDIDLGNESGLDFLDEVRESSNVDVLPITADDSSNVISCCYHHGCVDYITKPFSLNLLKVKIKSLIDSDTYKQGNIEINFNRRLCYVNNNLVKLTKKEFDLLEVLVNNRKIVLTKERLIDIVWGNDNLDVYDNTLTVTIRRLRSKIEENPKEPKYIETIFSIGYSWSDYGL